MNPVWIFEDATPHRALVNELAAEYQRTGVMAKEWREARAAWSREVCDEVERLGEKVGEALGVPVRVVWNDI